MMTASTQITIPAAMVDVVYNAAMDAIHNRAAARAAAESCAADGGPFAAHLHAASDTDLAAEAAEMIVALLFAETLRPSVSGRGMTDADLADRWQRLLYCARLDLAKVQGDHVKAEADLQSIRRRMDFDAYLEWDNGRADWEEYRDAVARRDAAFDAMMRAETVVSKI